MRAVSSPAPAASSAVKGASENKAAPIPRSHASATSNRSVGGIWLEGGRPGGEERKPPHKPQQGCFQIFPWLLASGQSAHRKPHHLARASPYQGPQAAEAPANPGVTKPQAALGSEEHWPRSWEGSRVLGDRGGGSATSLVHRYLLIRKENGTVAHRVSPRPLPLPAPTEQWACLLLSRGL